MNCPTCHSEHINKNGSIHTGKQKYICKDCHRQFVASPTKKVIPSETWLLVDKLLLERVSIAGISRVTGISEPWLQQYINKKYATINQKVTLTKKKGEINNSM